MGFCILEKKNTCKTRHLETVIVAKVLGIKRDKTKPKLKSMQISKSFITLQSFITFLCALKNSLIHLVIYKTHIYKHSNKNTTWARHIDEFIWS